MIQAGLLLAVASAGASPERVAAQSADPKIKHYIMIDMLDGYDRLWLDRWYMTYHAPERRQVVRNYQRHYLSYATYDIVDDLAWLNRIYGRMTEIHFDSMDDFRASRVNNGVNGFHTPTPGGERIFVTTTATIPTNPTEVFIGGYPRPIDHPYFRWIVFMNYPDGVARAEVEEWYLQTHARELQNLDGLLRFVSYQPVSGGGVDRVSELWFQTMQEWKSAVLDSPPTFTAPAWSDSFPFMEIQSAFIGERPDVDFMNDHRVIP
jgi:hypothetical protein